MYVFPKYKVQLYDCSSDFEQSCKFLDRESRHVSFSGITLISVRGVISYTICSEMKSFYHPMALI